jgi:hypothetical protein
MYLKKKFHFKLPGVVVVKFNAHFSENHGTEAALNFFVCVFCMMAFEMIN